MAERANGFYWVRVVGSRVDDIAFCGGFSWYQCGSNRTYTDKDFEWIGPAVPPPAPVVPAASPTHDEHGRLIGDGVEQPPAPARIDLAWTETCCLNQVENVRSRGVDGRVYIYDKEAGVWVAIAEIKQWSFNTMPAEVKAACQEQLAADRRDAARYRFLRSKRRHIADLTGYYQDTLDGIVDHGMNLLADRS